MRKFLVTIITLLLFAVILPGESSKANDVAQCGFQVGGNYTRFDGNPACNDSEVRLRFGLFASARLSRYFSYQAELNYVRKGGFGKEPSVSFYYDSTWYDIEAKLDYAEIPILIKVGPSLGASIRPTLAGGVYVAWVLEKHHMGSEYQPANSDWGLLFSVGLEPVIKGRTFIFEMRYTGGMKKIIDDPSGYRLNNRVLSFTIGVAL